MLASHHHCPAPLFPPSAPRSTAGDSQSLTDDEEEVPTMDQLTNHVKPPKPSVFYNMVGWGRWRWVGGSWVGGRDRG